MRGTWVVLIALACVGCKGLSDGAKEEFSQHYTCPPERVEVRERKDLDICELELPSKAEKPPEEVAADPERLKMWTKTRDDKRAAHCEYQRAVHHLFEVRGCDHTVLYNCNRPGRGSSPSAYYMCSEHTRSYPPGSPAW